MCGSTSSLHLFPKTVPIAFWAHQACALCNWGTHSFVSFSVQVESVSKHMLWEARHKVCGRLSPVGRHYVPSEDRQAKACHNTHQVSLPVLREREREASVRSSIYGGCTQPPERGGPDIGDSPPLEKPPIRRRSLPHSTPPASTWASLLVMRLGLASTWVSS